MHLGMNIYHGDAAAIALGADGPIGSEEERFVRQKHWAGFPARALRWVVGDSEIESVAVGRDPRAHLFHKAFHALKSRTGGRAILDRIRNTGRLRSLEERIRDTVGADRLAKSFHVIPVEHHRAHLASAFLCSPFERAALCSVDGFGDFLSTMTGVGEGNSIRVDSGTMFPHSPGLFYLAITQYLGFPDYGDEYKVMGLASIGEPTRLDEMRKILYYGGKEQLRLDLSCFRHHTDGVEMTWDDCQPRVGKVWTGELVKRFGPARHEGDTLEDRHAAVAASAQVAYEEAFHALLADLAKRTGERRLCLAGGCAMNSVANGKILEKTPFAEVFVQPAAGDAGTALGAALFAKHAIGGSPRDYVMASSYLGPEYSTAEIRALLDERGQEYVELGRSALVERAAVTIGQGRVLGWFQGRMEWGPRALGNRSILADPRRPGIREVLNERIKRRESFRPFAPSILAHRTGDYFTIDYPDPFMSKVYPVRPEVRALVPATTHRDGSGRLQTVDRESNPLYFDLISRFEELTGIPVVLNTSFNENEPIVCRPEEALDCFLRVRMDALALGNLWIERKGRQPQPPALSDAAARLARDPRVAR